MQNSIEFKENDNKEHPKAAKWETVVDFTEFKKGGMALEEVLRRLRTM